MVRLRARSVSNLAESDQKQVLEAVTHDPIREVGAVMDERGDDLSRIGEEAQDVTYRPEDFCVMIIIKQTAVPPVAIGEGVGAVEVVEHREVRS